MLKKYSLVIALAIVSIAGCKKDEYSRTKESLTRSWAITQVDLGTTDYTNIWTSSHQNYSLYLSKTGKYIENYIDEKDNLVNIEGNWSLSSDALKLTLESYGKSSSRVYDLILVDDDNLKFSKVHTSPKETYYYKSN